MPNLFVMRHGDADASAAGDRSRTLSPLGRIQAHESGERLAGLDAPPSQILCSSAPRALETARIVQGLLEEARGTLPFTAEDQLYLASAKTLRKAAEDLLQRSSGDLLLVAHQPGCGELISLLCDGRLELSSYPFRTAGVRRLELAAEGVLLPGSAHLTLEF